MGKHEGPKRAGHAVGSETALPRLDSETGQVKEFTQAEMGKGIIREAITWKRVQIHAAGMTQNR